MNTSHPQHYGQCLHLNQAGEAYNVTFHAMDVITAGLWALAGFDPALQHFAELREHLRAHPADSQLRVSLDRALGVYLQSQCCTIADAVGASQRERDTAILNTCNTDDGVYANGAVAEATLNALLLTDDPLVLEIISYGMHLSTFTSWGPTPFRRLSAVLRDCAHTAKEETPAP